ncbi:tRNA lysidine(34) synthetase TilS [soil metagenome]
MALLHIAADWARRRGRRLLAVTVDHGLNPDSPRWSETCRRVCANLGVDWIERRWGGDKPATGLTAAARAARHALIADAAREAGARVVLLAHTADDIAESDWMRAQGSTLGRLREWAPSPAWPQGRGLMLLRPRLDERREVLRGWLTGRGVEWIEDPGNRDPRFGRSRARSFLSGLPAGEARSPVETNEGLSCPQNSERQPLTLSHESDRFALACSSPLPLGEGFRMGRSISKTGLASARVCAGGASQPPRGERLTQLADRLASGDDFTATLFGARIVADGESVVIGREPGDFRRRATPDVRLEPGAPAVWDGRYELTATGPGWTVTSANGRLAALSDADRAILRGVPPWARGAMPVLIRDDGTAPVLAWRRAEVRALAPRRLELALSALGMGETTQESHLFRPVHGETPPTDLFSRPDHEPARVPTRRRGTEDRNEPA